MHDLHKHSEFVVHQIVDNRKKKLNFASEHFNIFYRKLFSHFRKWIDPFFPEPAPGTSNDVIQIADYTKCILCNIVFTYLYSSNDYLINDSRVEINNQCE